jgi:hypothetical protein
MQSSNGAATGRPRSEPLTHQPPPANLLEDDGLLRLVMSGASSASGGNVDYLTLVILVIPAVIGVVAAAVLGPNRGSIVGAGIMLIGVFVLLLFQVTPPPAASRFGSALGLMLFEWYRWVPSFLVGAAIGSLIFRGRRREPRA